MEEEPVRMTLDGGFDDEDEEVDEEEEEEEEEEEMSIHENGRESGEFIGQDRFVDGGSYDELAAKRYEEENRMIESGSIVKAPKEAIVPADSADLIDNGSILFFDDPKPAKRISVSNITAAFEPQTSDNVDLPQREMLQDQGGAVVMDFNEKYSSNFFIQRMRSDDIVYETQTRPPKFVAQYLFGEQVGEGSYGKVKEAFDSETLQRVAIKIMKRARLKKIPNGEENVKREISLMRRLKHPNVVQLLEVLYNDEKKKMYVVLEFCSGNLQDVIENAEGKKLGPGQTQEFFRQLMEGLGYLHSKSVIHRDIKPQNLLIAVDGTLKISDFGVAEELGTYVRGDTCTSSVGSPAFQSPEVALGIDGFSGAKVDVWAAGVTLYHMVSGKYPFEGENVYTLFENIGKGEYEMPSGLDDLLEDLLRGMLMKNPQERLSVFDVLNHPWLYLNFPRINENRLNVSLNFTSMGSIDPEVMITDTSLVPFLQSMYQEELNYLVADASENERNVMSLMTSVGGDNSSKSSFSSMGRRNSKMQVVKEDDLEDEDGDEDDGEDKNSYSIVIDNRSDEEKKDAASAALSTIKIAPRIRSTSFGNSQLEPQNRTQSVPMNQFNKNHHSSSKLVSGHSRSMILPNAIKSVSSANMHISGSPQSPTVIEGKEVEGVDSSNVEASERKQNSSSVHFDLKRNSKSSVLSVESAKGGFQKPGKAAPISGSGNGASVESISKRVKPSVSVRRPFFFYSYASKKKTLEKKDQEMAEPNLAPSPSRDSRPSTPNVGRTRTPSGFWNFVTSAVSSNPGSPMATRHNDISSANPDDHNAIKEEDEERQVGRDSPHLSSNPSKSGSYQGKEKKKLCILQ